MKNAEVYYKNNQMKTDKYYVCNMYYFIEVAAKFAKTLDFEAIHEPCE